MDFRLPSLFSRMTPGQAGELPADPFTLMQRDMNRMLGEMMRGFGPMPSAWRGFPGAMAPMIDVKDTDGALVVSAELPGVERADVEVELHDGLLTIRGEKKVEKEENEKGYYYSERSYGAFVRAVPLPFEVAPDKVEASFDKGVLRITLPKPAEAQKPKPQKIDVKGG